MGGFFIWYFWQAFLTETKGREKSCTNAFDTSVKSIVGSPRHATLQPRVTGVSL